MAIALAVVGIRSQLQWMIGPIFLLLVIQVVILPHALDWIARVKRTWVQEARKASPSTAPDRIARLKQLGDLRDAGVLTEDEFQQEKARLLGQPE
jgi:hypothetical protein